MMKAIRTITAEEVDRSRLATAAELSFVVEQSQIEPVHDFLKISGNCRENQHRSD